MKRIMLLMVGILSALLVAAPMVYAQSDNGRAPEDASSTYPPNLSPNSQATAPSRCKSSLAAKRKR
jgi:hypothetical protein